MDAVAYALGSSVPETYSGANFSTPRAVLPIARYNHGQSTLADGTVLVTGGSGAASTSVQSYDPATDVWTNKTSLPASRWDHGQSTLGDGTVLVTAGLVGGTFSSSTESYDPSTNSWTAKASFALNLHSHGQSTLADGSALITGGQYYNGSAYQVLGNVRRYDPVTNTWSNKASMINFPDRKYEHGQSTMDDGTVLVTGGRDYYNNNARTVYSYDPAANAWAAKTSLPTATIYAHGQSTLADGTALVTGGLSTTNRVFAYDRVANSWASRVPLGLYRYRHGQSTLADGSVLLTGGQTQTTYVEQYYPGGVLNTPGRAALLGYLAAN